MSCTPAKIRRTLHLAALWVVVFANGLCCESILVVVQEYAAQPTAAAPAPVIATRRAESSAVIDDVRTQEPFLEVADVRL